MLKGNHSLYWEIQRMLLFFHEIYQNLMRLELEQLHLSVWNSSFKKTAPEMELLRSSHDTFFLCCISGFRARVPRFLFSSCIWSVFGGRWVFFFFLSQDLFIYLFLLFLCSLLLFGYLGLKAKTKLVQIHFFFISQDHE